MLYYGYGSNLSQKYLQSHCPSTKYVMKAYLPNNEVQFRFWSKRRNGGISTIIPKYGELVHGILYNVSEEDIAVLDEREGIPQGWYTRDSLLVLGEDGEWYKADLYQVVEPEGPFTPSREYVETMIEGANYHGIDSGYIKKLEEILKTSA
jgi:cation transport regulator ChaC